jgi:V-type H+-transporting ATPase subunit C
LKEIVKA